MEYSFDDFARRELDGLLRYAIILTGDRELASDLVQDVLLKVLRHWSLVAGADNPRAYVRTMLTRAHLLWRRRWSVRHVVLHRGALPESEPIRDHAHDIAERDAIWQQLARLPRQQRTVLVLRYYEGLTDAEIAALLNCAPVTVRGYAARALASLRLDRTPVSSTTTQEKP